MVVSYAPGVFSLCFSRATLIKHIGNFRTRAMTILAGAGKYCMTLTTGGKGWQKKSRELN